MTEAAFIPLNEYNQLSPNEQEMLKKLFKMPDGIDVNFFHQVSILVKTNKYPWGCSRLIWIPKPGTKKERPITIPPFSGRMVQKSIRMVLEAIYEPLFQKMNCSFGFRASNGVHQAITLITNNSITNGMNKAIEGDIESAYPNLDRKILVNILGERIIDKKFLSFMTKRLHLKLFDTKDKQYKQTFLGIPQGGIHSPYLWNIYLLGLDQFVQKDIQEYLNQINKERLKSQGWSQEGKTTKKPPRNPISNRLDRQLQRLKKEKLKIISKLKDPLDKEPEDLMKLRSIQKDIRLTLHKKRQVPYYDASRKPLRMLDLRYADDWIIFCNAPENILIEVKKKIALWLKTKRAATLSEEKTVITDMRSNYAHFLGFQFKNSDTRRLKRIEQKGKRILKRTTGWSIIAQPYSKRLINRLFMKGYCDKNGFPREIHWLSTFEASTIIQKFNSVITGFSNFYADS